MTYPKHNYPTMEEFKHWKYSYTCMDCGRKYPSDNKHDDHMCIECNPVKTGFKRGRKKK